MKNYRNKTAMLNVEEVVSDIVENFSIEDIEAVLYEEDGEYTDQLLSIIFEGGDAIGYEILNRLEQYVSNAHQRQAKVRKLASVSTREIVAELNNRKRIAHSRRRHARYDPWGEKFIELFDKYTYEELWEFVENTDGVNFEREKEILDHFDGDKNSVHITRAELLYALQDPDYEANGGYNINIRYDRN